MKLMKLLPSGVLVLMAVCLSGCPRPLEDIPTVSGGGLVAEYGWEPKAPMLQWDYIVVHHSATRNGSAKLFHKWHLKKGWDGLGYHFVIGNGTSSGDGQVEVGYRWERQITGAHCGGRNNIGKIGVCLVGNFDMDKPTVKQMNSLKKLLKFLQVRCGIPAERVRGHSEVVRKGYTHCPGKRFSMDALRSGLFLNPRMVMRSSSQGIEVPLPAGEGKGPERAPPAPPPCHGPGSSRAFDTPEGSGISRPGSRTFLPAMNRSAGDLLVPGAISGTQCCRTGPTSLPAALDPSSGWLVAPSAHLVRPALVIGRNIRYRLHDPHRMAHHAVVFTGWIVPHGRSSRRDHGGIRRVTHLALVVGPALVIGRNVRNRLHDAHRVAHHAVLLAGCIVCHGGGFQLGRSRAGGESQDEQRP